MATITFNSFSGSNIVSAQTPMTGLTKLTATSNNAPWIYCNYPEQIGVQHELSNSAKGPRTGLALADYGYYINQQTINGPGQIFYSHWNRGGKTLKYRIQIYNGNSTAATVTRSNIGHSSGWTTPANAVTAFFASSSKTISVPARGVAWLTDEYSIANEQPFCGMVRFNSNKSVIITVYAYYSASKIDGNAVSYPYKKVLCDSKCKYAPTRNPGYQDYCNDIAVYSGRGTGYFLTFNHGEISTNSLPYRHNTNEHNKTTTNTNEIVPITLINGNKVTSVSSTDKNLTNVGNWGVQNCHKMTFYNPKSTSVTVYGYIGANPSGNTQVINRGGVVKTAKLETGKLTWRWCKIVLAAGERYTFDFQQVLASYGAAATFYEWKLT